MTPTPRLVPDRPSDAHVGQAFREVYIGGSQSSTAGLALAVMHRARTLHDAAAPPAEAPGDKEHGGTYLFSRPGPCAAPAAPAPVPADVMAALDRMCTPLDPSWIKGSTMKRDAECMAIIRDYILSAPRVTGGRESITGVVNGYLHRAQCVEFKADSPLPAWLTASPGLRVTMTLQAATGGGDA